MEILQAILLGIIEGLTEFLPISSTGHLIIAEQYIDFKDTAKIFTVAVQLGALLAVIWYYRHDIKRIITDSLKGNGPARKFIGNLVLASIPAGLLGLALDKKFEDYATPRVVAIALIAGAFVLWAVDKRKPPKDSHSKDLTLEKITPKQSILIGLMQCLALVPGASRSGASIVGGLLTGLNRVTATAFSFYLAIPILGAAGLYKLATSGGELSTISGGGTSLIIGIVVSFIVALASISWLLKYVSSHSFKIFVYYRILLGIAVLILLS
jgi:undecaprenyl-diphosphatase